MSFSVNINYARPAAPPAANVGTFLIATARTEASSCPFNTIVERLHAYLHKISSYWRCQFPVAEEIKYANDTTIFSDCI